MRKTITDIEKKQLEGLLLLAQSHNVEILAYEMVMCRMLAIRDGDLGHIGDAIYNESPRRLDFDTILERMGITVEEDTDAVS
jgi:hypothetical protein